MVDRIYVKCNFCNTKILLRFQIGEFDIPFSFGCPMCNVNLNGVRRVNNNSLELYNATPIEPVEPDYYTDLSIELPHRKIQKYVSFESLYSNGVGPFIDLVRLFKTQQDYMDVMKKIREFLLFKTNKWNLLNSLYDIYIGNKIEFIKEPILSFLPNYIVNNKLDAAMALHQSTVIGMNKILAPNCLEEFKECSNKIMGKNTIFEVKRFVEFLKNNENFDFQVKRILKIYSRWVEDFEKYIPIVTISLGKLRDVFNKENYGIATISFDNMISFYNDTYELLLDMVTVAVGLNNIFVRGNFNKFISKSNLENFDDYYKLTKSQRLNALSEEEPFSKYICMDRNVRNAIAHYTYDFENNTQKIYFYDKYKNKEKIKELYLCDLALLCYDNIAILVYLNELFYNIRKIDLLGSGMIPNIRF